jgi:hypothetical protein
MGESVLYRDLRDQQQVEQVNAQVYSIKALVFLYTILFVLTLTLALMLNRVGTPTENSRK